MMIDFAIEAERDQGLSPSKPSTRRACCASGRFSMTTLAALLGGVPLAIATAPGPSEGDVDDRCGEEVEHLREEQAAHDVCQRLPQLGPGAVADGQWHAAEQGGEVVMRIGRKRSRHAL